MPAIGKGRHGSTGPLLEIAQTMRPNLQGVHDKLPKRELPKAMVWLAAPFVGMTRDYVTRNVGHPLQFENRRSEQDLGIEYRSPEQTFTDHITQIASDRLLKGRSNLAP